MDGALRDRVETQFALLKRQEVTEHGAIGAWVRATSAPTVAAVEPTAEPAPTATSEPTVAPTETAVVVAEPTTEPLATSDPSSADPDETAYAADMAGELKTLGAGLTIVQEQLKKVAAGTAGSDAGWAEKTKIGIGMVRLAVTGMRALTAPTRFELVHGQLLLASDHYENSMNLLEAGLTEGNLVKVGQAADAMTLAGEFVDRAQGLWDAEMGVSSAPPARPAAAKDGNLRAGPGTGFAVVGGVSAGDGLEITGRNEAGDWFELADGGWIAAFLVANPPGAVPVAAVIPTEPTQPPASAQRAAPVLPAAEMSNCDCSGNKYNCDDFVAFDSQACYLRCKAAGVGDIHDLDRDNDGSACEWEY